jgi:hypothetical protein
VSEEKMRSTEKKRKEMEKEKNPPRCVSSRRREDACASSSSVGHRGTIAAVRVGSKTAACAKRTNHAELRFYEEASQLRGVMPRFHGTCKFPGDADPRVVLENMKRGMARPREMDVKIGRYTSDLRDLLSMPTNVMQALRKDAIMKIVDTLTSSSRINFRVTAHPFRPLNAIQQFFAADPRGAACRSTLRQLQTVHEAIRNLPRDAVLVGMSVLIVYDEKHPTTCRVRLIDFAHSHLKGLAGAARSSVDECVTGIRKLSDLIRLHAATQD